MTFSLPGLLILAFLLPSVVYAHGPIKGLGYFYNGMLHPLFVPGHIMLIVAVGFLMGRDSIEKNLPLFIISTLSVALGLITTHFMAISELSIWGLLITVVIGAVIAINASLSRVAIGLLVALGCFFIGIDSPQDGLEGQNKLASLFGTFVGGYLLLLYPALVAEFLSLRGWTLILLRVVGSCIAAASVLNLALILSAN